MTIREETHRINYEQRVRLADGGEPEGGGLYGSDRRAAGGALQKRASGGPISGYGTSTSDEVPFMGSDGEHVLDKGDVLKMGGHQGVYKFRAALHAGQLDHLAAGGGVGTSRSVSPVQFMLPHYAKAAPTEPKAGMHIEKLEINEQSDPRATFHEFARRTYDRTP